MAIDRKYGVLMFDEPNTIGHDEPVFVLRAADPLAVEAIASYAALCADAGSPPQHMESVRGNVSVFQRWQVDNPDKVRALPTSSNWDGVPRV